MGNVVRTGRGMATRRPRVTVRRDPRLAPPRRASAMARGGGAPARSAPHGITLALAVADMREALAEAAYAAAEAAARATALAEVLASLPGAEGSRAPLPALPARADAILSPREREVLALVAEGQTNKDIASALFVSPNTVKRHVTSLLNKLHASTRVQLATIAARQGLA
jgi:DNA-binding NarL/FixJ family response regulator